MTDDLADVEGRIRPHVAWMREQGIKTESSCGHDMYVMIDWPLGAMPQLASLLHGRYGDDFTIEIAPMGGPPPYGWWVKVVLLGENKGDGRPEDLVLLKVDPAAHPLYFVIRERHYDFTGYDDDGKSRDEYFYGEHTCPTNWTGSIEAVISKGDPDPHGFATFVRRIPAPETMESCNDEQYLELFPEAADERS